ncbi:MAG: flagellar protein FlgN [Lachnospiraceae bacterium]|jgi:DNA-binding protein H-NS|nr:flagellar protein FlgN [Lachnospiraceae bacterium]
MNNKEDRVVIFDSFIHTLEELSKIIEKLTEAEKAKAETASAGEHGKMDSFLKEEQALLLKLRGLEQLRGRQASDLGWTDLTFRQILAAATERERSVLSPLFSKMEQLLKELADAEESSSRIVSVRLREFEHILGVNSQNTFPEINGSSHFHDRYV